MCVPVVVCIRHDDVRSITSRAIVHRPPARSLDRPIVCVVYACVTRLVLRFTNSMLRALPATPCSPCDAPGISRYTHPEGEPCKTYYVPYGNRVAISYFLFVVEKFRGSTEVLQL